MLGLGQLIASLELHTYVQVQIHIIGRYITLTTPSLHYVILATSNRFERCPQQGDKLSGLHQYGHFSAH